MEKARNAIRNLNGTIIRGRSMKVSFAKYDTNGMPWKGAASQVFNQAFDLMGTEDIYRKTIKETRNFKEVVVGLHHQIEVED